jgi:hypothetical protein
VAVLGYLPGRHPPPKYHPSTPPPSWCPVALEGLRPSHAPAGCSRRQPLSDEFFVSPGTAVVAPPNLSAHKPAGNCAPRDDDRAQMPSRCLLGALAQSKGEADRYHRDPCFNRRAFMYGPYRTSWCHS